MTGHVLEQYCTVTHVFVSCNSPTTSGDLVSVIRAADDQSREEDSEDSGQPLEIHTA